MSDMERIASFSVDHNRLLRGIYVSRKDPVGGEWITTFDIRMKEPNREPVIDVPPLHTIEHLGATWLRNNTQWSDKIIYFGPMGCRTGCYMLLRGNLESRDVLAMVKEMFEFIVDYNESIPGAAAEECGNWLSQDLPMAAWESRKFVDEVLNNPAEANLAYPD